MITCLHTISYYKKTLKHIKNKKSAQVYLVPGPVALRKVLVIEKYTTNIFKCLVKTDFS